MFVGGAEIGKVVGFLVLQIGFPRIEGFTEIEAVGHAVGVMLDTAVADTVGGMLDTAVADTVGGMLGATVGAAVRLAPVIDRIL
jgi:hypothetical protein